MTESTVLAFGEAPPAQQPSWTGAASVADAVGSAPGVAAVWIIGGVIALCGALALAELAAAIPEPGGVFVYLREV